MGTGDTLHSIARKFGLAPSDIARQNNIGLSETLLAGEPPKPDPLDTMILIVDGRIYRKSTAALMTAARLDGAWPLLAMFLVVPRPLRNAVYDWIGRRRYRLFGRQNTCWVPASALADRFLDMPGDHTAPKE